MIRCFTVLLLLALSAIAQATWQELDAQADSFYRQGNLQEALRVAELALRQASTPQQKGRSLDRLGFFQYSLGQREEAEVSLLQALEIRGQLGRETTAYADTLLNLAMLQRDLRRLDEALKSALECVAIRGRLLTRNHPDYAEGLNALGTIYYLRNEFEPADRTLEEGLRIHEAQLDPKKPSEEYGVLCIQFAQVAQRMGNYPKATQLFEKGLKSLRLNPGVQHPAYSVSLGGAAFLAQDLGHYEAAEKLNAEALPLMKSQLGPMDPRVGQILNNQGVVYQSLGNFTAAKAAYEESLAIKRKTAEKVSLAVTLRNLGRLLMDRDRAQAEPLYQEAVGLLEQASPPPAYEYANTLLSLGQAQMSGGNLAAAGTTLQLALTLTKQLLGEKHPLYSAILLQLARLAEAQGQPAEAARQYRQAIDVVAASKGKRHSQIAEYLVSLAGLEARQGRPAEALALYREASIIHDMVQTQALGVGSEAAKSTMLASLPDLVPELLAFQAGAGKALPEARALAFAAVTRRKARVIDFIRDWRGRLREEAGESARPLLEEWQALADCQVSLSIALGYRDWRRPTSGGCTAAAGGRYEPVAKDLRTAWTEPRATAALAAIQELRQSAEKIEERLSRDLPAFRQSAGRVSLAEIRAGLRPDELLVEIVRYDSGTAGNPKPRYGAFVADSVQALEWVDLGPASTIETAVRDILQSADDWSVSLAQRETVAAVAAQRTATKVMDELSLGSFAPLWKLLSQSPQVRRLRIAPDALLLLLPFEALPFQQKALLQRFTVSYVLAGREIVPDQRAFVASGRPLIAVSPGLQARASAGGGAFRADKLERLAAAGAEGRQLLALMPGAELLGENEATEQALKQIHHPAVLHIIGHGVLKSADELKTLDPYSRIMSLSAIVLEEAYGRGTGSKQDGILTAQELRSLDLGGTEMLVLSQCRMADGVPTSGDGVYGMRRAASLAGAQSFIAPLWKVSDQAQGAMVARLYRELSAGRDRARALQSAKLELLMRPATSHFFYWAPTILSGKIDPLPRAIFTSNVNAK